MNVKGVEITEQQLAAMLQAMGERFRAADVMAAAEAAGVQKGEVAMRRSLATEAAQSREDQDHRLRPVLVKRLINHVYSIANSLSRGWRSGRTLLPDNSKTIAPVPMTHP